MESNQVTTAMHGNAPPLTWADCEQSMLRIPPVPPAVPLRVPVDGYCYLLSLRANLSELERLTGLPVVIDWDANSTGSSTRSRG